ncbi:MAG: hypothetical protein JW934_12570 [Anaerolineae bacterium]|nr:hypothetical protein [Anaerolineae bacterium]
MTLEQANSLEQCAYREAGHAVMSYLIRGGFIEEFVPIYRSLILPKFDKVAIEGPSADWAKATLGLGSLMTVPQVLLAGHWAAQIMCNEGNDNISSNSPLTQRALQFVTSYIEEYGGHDMSFAERDEQAQKTFSKMFVYVGENVQTYWASIESLAKALLRDKVLTEEQAFSVIEADISEEAKVKAGAFASRSPEELFEELFGKIEEQVETTIPPNVPTAKTEDPIKRKKTWWKFWRR